ncbi:hypothetical protein J5N97_002401 [Dioscorea zingiberensis]|uniref:Bulb-type lectin domain-containing protein n=1 Tax=Dioscorea zingiberensis TaxID=325984 RepID=A0A9D5HP62_9LILI|nr:hypothetical protein J5N97_002401 [Dioscorea zingiberensis]
MAIPSPIPHLLLLLFLFLPALPISFADYVLYSGEVITSGQNLTNGDFQLSLRPNCDLIITNAGKPIWRANTSGHGSDCYLGFKHNGELVVRHGVHYTLWSSGSKSKKGKYALLLDNNGKLSIFGQRRWTSNNQKDLGENTKRTVITTEYVLHSGHRLNPGKQLSYQNLLFGLSHCNLVINETSSGRILWQTNTKANGCYVQLENNGELTVKHLKQKLWSSNKRSDNGAYIGVLRYDGRFAVYGPLLWNNDKKDTVELGGLDSDQGISFMSGDQMSSKYATMKPSSHHPALLLLQTISKKTPSTFKQLHAHFITSGLALHSYPLSRLLLFSSLPPLSFILPPSYSISILLNSPHTSTFLFNTLIASFSSAIHLTHLSFYLYSLLLLPCFPKPNSHTFPSLLKACSSPLWALHGPAIHAHIIKFQVGAFCDGFAHTSLINFYSKFGKISVCRHLFDEIPKPDLAAWNSIISAYARCCVDEGGGVSLMEALDLFRGMLLAGFRPSEMTLVSVIGVCGDLGTLAQGLWAHVFMGRSGLEMNRFVGTALIDMYSKCGWLGLAEQVFDGLLCRDTLCYNAMIRGLAMHGKGTYAVDLFDRMRHEGVRVDEVTLVVVMCACAHAGLVDDGCRIFYCMEVDFGIKPKMEHYGCLVDLLGRAGRLEDAEEVLHSMPMKPNASLYRSLLGACRINKKLDTGERVISELIEMEPEHGGNYVLLSNIYANANRWDDVRKVRKMMKDRGVSKNPGSSLIEMNGTMHKFMMGDRTHPNSKEIYMMLDEIGRKLHEFGHRPITKEFLFDVEEEDKEDALSYHSERLAIAFALVASGTTSPIRIIKNLRVCSDCHSSTKLISMIYKREIIMRDRGRFHHFKDGMCSCSDYW